MSSIKEMRYKDESPDKTVARLKEILKKHGIRVEENWKRKSSVGTYSLRLCIKGTNIGQNGKGMTKDFALASAYAEFFERYQNGVMVFRQEKPSEEFPFVYASDEICMTAKQLANENNQFIERLYKSNISEKERSKVNQENFLKELFNENELLVDRKEKYISLPYYSVNKKDVVHLPHVLSCHLCGTNGMCAGNTPEEAIIEGISEVLERYVSMQLIYQRPTLPEVPKKYLEKYPKVYQMLEKLENNDKYIYKLLDCSLGGKYPVAGLAIIQKNTGKFGFKLGAHPDYGIAMERCFTEASQGMDIYEYAKGCLFDFKNHEIELDENVKEFVDTTIAVLPYQLFGQKYTYPFTEMADVSKMNNKEILQYLVKSIQKQGYDILVRNVSVFGFPSYRIIIPGMNEIMHSSMGGRFNMFETIEYLLKDFKRINLDNITRVIEMMEKLINEAGYQHLASFISIKDASKLKFDHIGLGAKYFLSLCYIMDKKYEKAEELLEEIMFMTENLGINTKEELSLIKAVYYYNSAMNKIKKHEEVMYYMHLLFTEDIVNKIEFIFKERKNILINSYDITQEDYVDNDDAYYLPYMKELRKMQKENPINQIEIKSIFEN